MFSCHCVFIFFKEADSRTALLRTTNSNEKYASSNTSRLVVGVLMAFISAVLFDVVYVINKKLKLTFNDSLLTGAVVQTIVFTMAIFVYNYEQTRRQNRLYRQNIDGGIKTRENIPIWICTVDDHHNIHIIRTLLIVQGVCAALCLLTAYISVTVMPLGDAMAIVFTSPLSTMLLAFFVSQTTAQTLQD